MAGCAAQAIGESHTFINLMATNSPVALSLASCVEGEGVADDKARQKNEDPFKHNDDGRMCLSNVFCEKLIMSKPQAASRATHQPKDVLERIHMNPR